MDFSVSVIIPTFNRRAFLREALESVCQQTCAAAEIIVVDDGSTDGTEEMIKTLPGPIRYLSQANQGPAAARNFGMREARTEWIAFLDSDDRWLPEKLQLQANFLEAHPNLDFIFGTQVNEENGNRSSEPEILDIEVYRALCRQSAEVRDFFDLLLRHNPVPTSSVVFRRSCLEKVGAFEEHRWRCEDYELWFRFARECRAGFLNAPLVVKRAHQGNLINDYIKLWSAHLDVLHTLPRKHGEFAPNTRRLWQHALAQTTYRLASFELSRGLPEAAAPWFAQTRCRDLVGREKYLALLKKALLWLGLGAVASRTAGALRQFAAEQA